MCIVKCQMDLPKWKKEAVCKRSSCEKRKLRPLISCVSICSRTGRPNRCAAIRNQLNSPPSHPCPHNTLFHEPPPPTFLSAQAPGPLWVNLTQPWPENRVVSYSSNPLLSHHAIKYALQPLTSQVRETPPPSGSTTLPTSTKGPIKKRKVRIVWKRNHQPQKHCHGQVRMRLNFRLQIFYFKYVIIK